MILVADSGSTKTDWACFSRDNDEIIRFATLGYNPNYISGPLIIADIQSCMPEDFPVDKVEEIFFYGAGVTEIQYPFMRKVLSKVFRNATNISIAMDTLASCRALLGREAGFAAIMGTGTNTCLYDGTNETMNVDSCGFILGDEGSGGYLGKRLITDYIRHNMPAKVYKMVGRVLQKSNDELIDQVYTKPFPSRYCAQYSRFIREKIGTDPYFENLVTDAFNKMFDRIVTHYPDYQTYKFNSVGSVAFYYKDILEKVAASYGMELGTIIKSPLEGLIKFHKENII